MGRTSKFSFPIPGRKQSSSNLSKESTTLPSRTSIQPMSKAQRLLGTEKDLNIDSPTAEEYPLGFPSPKPSRMSIAISETTNGSGGSAHGSHSEQWDFESGVLPRSQRLRGKASSTLLGQRYGDDGTTAITASERLRHEDSSSTLKSHYDRLKSPLSISQQTSDSSARDLALRKGAPPVVLRRPLLQIDFGDPFDTQFPEAKGHTEESRSQGDASQDRGSKKKPAKLDLSMLFPKSRNRGSKSPDVASLTPSVSPLSTSASRTSVGPGHRKLNDAPSKESLQSRQSIRSNQSFDPKKRNSSLTSSTGGTSGTLYQLYDHYEQMPVRSPRMDCIPESKVPERIASRAQAGENFLKSEPSSRQPKDRESIRRPEDGQPSKQKNGRSSTVSPRHEASSAASISSRNTKSSRHTNRSAISNSDLTLKSVLSLSSDSEGDSPEVRSSAVSARSKESRGSSHKINDNQRRTRESSEGLKSRNHSARNSSKKISGQERHVYSIPETSSTDGYSSRRAIKEPPRSSHHRKDSRQSIQKEEQPSRKPSIASVRSLQPTPPLSPASSDTREAPEKSSRLMTVTKQEEKLLEALRQKRARMRADIIEEHISRSPPRIPDNSRARHSEASCARKVRDSERQRILLYLDTPISDSQQIDTAEPSPDLSDFLSYGSDEDSTPRTSWAPPPKIQARPDSTTRSRRSRASPMTPPSAARLSAVGAPLPVFSIDSPPESVTGAKKRGPSSGVRFVEETKVVDGHGFLLDDADRVIGDELRFRIQ